MVNLDNEPIIQNTNTSEDFGSMLDESMKNLNPHLKKGDVVEGLISSISETHLIISLGVKQDGYAEIGDYYEEGEFKLHLGDKVKGFIVDITDNQITIAKSLNRSHGNKILVKEAFDKQIPVKGKVMGTVKGGYTVELFGLRGFCPFSHIDLFANDKSDKYLHNSYDFEILEFEKGNIILSRKNLLSKEYKEQKEKFFSTIQVNDVVQGTVVKLSRFGAFVDLGGIEGLLHISEVSWYHIAKIDEVLKIGDTIQVKILKIEKEKISLSLRVLQENPIIKSIEKYKINDLVTCKVLRNETFGSFVEIEKGVEGLIPISLMSKKRISKPSEVVKVGDQIEARVIEIQPEKMKITLSLREEEVDTWESEVADLKQGQEITGIIENITEHGIFLKVNHSVVGLIPQSKVTKAGLKFTKENLGEEFLVRVSSINTQAHRLSLEPLNMPISETINTSDNESGGSKERKDRKEKGNRDYRKPNKDNSQNNEWQKYSSGYQSVPEDNPFNKL